jgi:hypothetical protein
MFVSEPTPRKSLATCRPESLYIVCRQVQPVYLVFKNCKCLSLCLLAVLGLFPAFVTSQDSASSSETQSFALATPRNTGIKGAPSFQRVWGPMLKNYADQRSCFGKWRVRGFSPNPSKLCIMTLAC